MYGTWFCELDKWNNDLEKLRVIINGSMQGYVVLYDTVQLVIVFNLLYNYSKVTVLCPVLAQDAIQAALKDYKSKNDDADGGQAESSAN